MSGESRPTGHLQVRSDRGGRSRSYWAFWRDKNGVRGGRQLGLAHVRDSGRRTARGATIWRAGNGPRPTPEHLTPRDAEERLAAILRDLGDTPGLASATEGTRTLRDATQGWVVERTRDKQLKRSTVAGYETLFERFYRDFGADTPLRDFADGRLRDYFDDFRSYKVVSEKTAEKASADGNEVRLIGVERWIAQPRSSLPALVATKAEAVKLADEMPGTWAHLRVGAYRVRPLDARRAVTVTEVQAKELAAQPDWIVTRVKRQLWTIVGRAKPGTRNEARDVLSACFNYAVRKRWTAANPMAEIKRTSMRGERDRILRRDDFYDPTEVSRLLDQSPGLLEEAFWLCGAHAGLRLPGEALGIRWGAVDFKAMVLRPYDNWVRGRQDTTKTPESAAIPMTPRLARTLGSLKERGYATSDEDYVFVRELEPDHPAPEHQLREAFKLARAAAELKPIRMYNLRHSFGTGLAADGIDVRTIQALMRHTHLTTTEQYLAYSPRPELASQIARALDRDSAAGDPLPLSALPDRSLPAFFERLEEEIPAKWLHEVRRAYTESAALQPATEAARTEAMAAATVNSKAADRRLRSVTSDDRPNHRGRLG
jgi:integrase